MRLRTRFALLLTLCVLVPLSLVSLLAWYSSSALVNGFVRSDLSVAVEHELRDLEAYLDNAIRSSVGWSGLHQIREVLVEGGGEVAQGDLGRLKSLHPWAADLAVIDQGGRVLASTAGFPLGSSLAREPEVAQALGGVPAQGRVRPLGSGAQPVIVVAVPIRAQDGQTGAMVVALDWDHIRAHLARPGAASSEEDFDYHLVLAEVATGDILFASAGAPLDLTVKFPELLPAATGVSSFDLGGREYLVGIAASRGRELLLDPGWRLVALVETELAFAGVEGLKWTLLWLSLGSFMLVVGAGLAAADRVTMPIREMIGAMKRIIAGERGLTLSCTDRGDEIGELARSFNSMSRAIAQAEARLQGFAQSASVWLWEMDENLRFTPWSETLRMSRDIFPGLLTGLTRWEAVGADPETDEFWRQHRADLLAHRPFHDFRYTFKDARGLRRHFKVSGVPIIDEAGVFRGYRGISTDDTAGVDARARAEQAEAMLLESVETISEGFALYDEHDELVLCNSKFHGLRKLAGAFGRSRFAGKGLEEREEQLEDGRWVLLREWRTSSGGTIALHTDITELKNREQELMFAKESAELANRAKSEFLANMSHELRTPLNAIIGFSELMKTEVFGPLGDTHYRAYASDICESGTHLLQIINDILDLSKIEAARFELHEEELHLAEVVRSSVRIVNQRAADAGVELVIDIDRSVPTLLADQRCLKQILLNLLSNAVKFTLSGGRVTVSAWMEPGGDLNLAVVDTGIGMAAEDLPKALACFSQVDSRLARKYQGTGLGLPLTKKLVELHGGTLSLESEPGVGTTVRIAFPRERVFPDELPGTATLRLAAS